MIEIKNLTKTYSMGAAQVHALSGVSLKIEAGEFVAIMGVSGSGKSTLMHLMGLLDRPDSGSYVLRGVAVTKLSDDQLAATRNRLFGFVFQQFHLLPRMTALENAELPLIYAGKRHLKDKAREKIEEVGLGDRMLHRPNELSGGEQQRVAIARSLVNEPLIILADEPTGNLDSKSKIEILSVLKQLNEKGKTVVVVTHENEIAEHAKRIIKMRDGQIISDEPNCKESGKCETKTDGKPVEEVQKFSRQAEFLDYLRQAAGAMASHKMRTFLSILGILIGVAAVIAMLALGQGAQESISKQLSSLGSNLLLVMPGSARVHGVSMGTGTITRFTFQDVAAISKMPEDIKRIYPSVQGRGQLVYGNKNWSTSIEGDGPAYAETRNSVPVVGRFFTEEEVKLRDKVAVIGFTVARELFGDVNPVGKTIKINLINFKVIGILPTKGASGWHDQDDVVIIPVTTAMYRVFGKEYLDSIFVEVKSPDLIADTQDAITKLIIKQHRLSKDNEDSFQI
ncbi:ABC transporter permease, partial [Patescibacteria group bacterium]|nr:ABC transporter permease [Patescibacteria group bacterium]